MWRVILLLLLLLPLSAEARKLTLQPQDIDSITVLAPTSMAVPVSELCKIYSVNNKKDVNAVFDSAGNNMQNIEDGDPADIVIVPSNKWLAALDSKGLIDNNSVTAVASDDLAVVASKSMELGKQPNAKAALDNIYNKALLVVADDENEALGEYTTAALLKMGLWDKFHARSVIAPTSSAVVDLVIKGQSAGIAFGSDAKLYSGSLNTVAIIPQAMHKRIEYLGAVVVGEDMAEARDFLKFLASKPARDVFRKYGFVVQ